ncbi:MAG: RNA methyltransferase [Alicyclobacillaceae bacterium]|nr:RNA methyltransferase [Alicyclobacillaceae bacterium]
MGDGVIRSVHNEQVKAWTSLQQAKQRRRTGLFLAEGPRVVEEALAAGAPVKIILYDEENRSEKVAGLLAEARRRGVEVRAVAPHVLAKICETVTPQGVVAVVGFPESHTIRERLGKSGLLMVALDGVQDPGNVGAVLRVARAVGVHGVLCGRETADPFSPKAVRASMGAIFSVPVWSEELAAALMQWKKEGVRVVGTGAGGDVRYDCWDWTVSTAVVLGSEGRGIGRDVQDLCDGFVYIPMPGGGESLNVATAAAVLLYEAWRQRAAGCRNGA